ncbi:MAG: phosphoenolpyruvate--protein phosphotransferase [Desulfobacteraceae bacterium 4572_123]|nr:MAG: phosphoenolpyruvate--protein phosphotransferase [Desulfobacteraceae bacterium 4572_123]
MAKKQITLEGISGAPGICIGKAYLVDTEGVDIVEKYFIHADALADEIIRFKAAVKDTRDELLEIISNTPEELHQSSYILETHVALLEDKMLYGRAIETIEKQYVNAEWALKTVISDIKVMFQNITDDYLKERKGDIMHVANRIMAKLAGVESVNIAEIDKRVILVASDLSPAQTSQIQLERIKGFITDRGGKTSHTTIIARSLGIPAVLGLDNATDIIQTDDIIIVDGTTGKVIINPDEETLVYYEERRGRFEAHKAVLVRGSRLPAETKDGLLLQVMGNIELPEEVVLVLDNGGEGIGLYRTEFEYMNSPSFPGEDELFERYRDVVEVMGRRPVTIRTLDINGDKSVACAADRYELNPALGLRAIRYCLKKPDIFETQLRAILRASAFGNVKILIPMISCCGEIDKTRLILDKAAESLEKEGIPFDRDIKVGIMIEVPSAVIMADIMAEKVDFFSIGTNDLIQYSLAIDRGNREVSHLFQPLHPAILRMIHRVTDVAVEKGIDLVMCGEMAADPLYIPVILGLGIKNLSMNPQSIPLVKSVVRALKKSDMEPFMKEVMKQTNPVDIETVIQHNFGTVFSEKIYSR